jgi:hypothetical protein
MPTSLYIWEESKDTLGFVKALPRLSFNILFKPVVFFKELTLSGTVDIKKRLWRAALFAFIFGYLKLFIDLSFLSGGVANFPLFFIRPVISFLVTLILVTTSVKLILGFDKLLVPVFLVVCYRSAAEIFYCIPVFGPVFAGVWGIALLAVGIKEIYYSSMVRAVLAAVLMPLIMLLFIFLSLGPAANRVVLALYPEAQKQVVKLNDLNAYIYVSSIAAGAQAYRKDLGFYPSHLGALKKYLGSAISEDVTNPDNATGYVYEYTLANDDHFTLLARPLKELYSGRFVFYTDETGLVRLNAREGEAIRSLKDMEGLIMAGTT